MKINTHKNNMNKLHKQIVYLLIKVEDELPNEFDIVTFVARVPAVNRFQNLEPEKEIDFSFRGWRENDKFLIYGVGEELSDGKVTHWFKPQEGYFFIPKQFNEHNQNVIKQTLETAAENATLLENGELTYFGRYIVEEGNHYSETEIDVSKESITNTFEETYKKFEV